MALSRPITKPTKLVVLWTYVFTFGYIRVSMAIMKGVVGQNITPNEDVSKSKGLKSGLSSAFIGDQIYYILYIDRCLQAHECATQDR